MRDIKLDELVSSGSILSYEYKDDITNDNTGRRYKGIQKLKIVFIDKKTLTIEASSPWNSDYDSDAELIIS